MDALSPSEAKINGTTLAMLLREARSMLANAGIENSSQEAVWLLESAFSTSRLDLLLKQDRVLNHQALAEARSLLARRTAREPLQYILGTQEFCGLEFDVAPSVLIPRPETELLVQEIVRRLPPASVCTILDIGTGSGCLAVTLARLLPSARVYGTDCSEAALEVADRNRIKHGVQERVTYLRGNLYEPLRGLGLELQVEVIVSNPPYISESDLAGLQPEVALFEPRLALAGGKDGLKFYGRLLSFASEFLAVGGFLVMEVGQGQAKCVCELARQHEPYGDVYSRRDPAGIERVVCVERKR